MESVLLFVGYLLGSIPFALVVGRIYYGADIRDYGSGNLGATNSIRLLGKKAGAVVLAGDIFKGVLACLLPIWLEVPLDPLYAGAAAVFGHCFPIFAGFRGGKAVATTAGVLLVADPILCLITFGIFFIVIGWTKYVAAGSLAIAPVLFLFSFFQEKIEYTYLFALFIPFMLFLHRTNIMNFIKGIEPKINDKNIYKDQLHKKK
ncbi:glycerol-3-phosphate 1-O-acyltransferase PlsY [Peribacillus deserti]|uniref:Glycerol-3-phosphate acyltransferase n=1 Tax=Peribacillus deserti TaxID=673318 RepID=A0A2N5M088_9BACI|nr:glycerol-3-phosphate 1-O-acyltransferase PlsY [Peribacillus deserti]PLT27735.1 acyl-phosphate glycerol 3-phosphate acyltransferase [Peribacillus deserti]